jgi:ABC-type lipoprotein release transport system permease subunit
MIKTLLAYRYVFKQRIAYMAILVIALSVFVVTVVMTVMNGLVGDFKKKNHAFVGDCVIGTDSLVGFPYYEEALALVSTQDVVEAVSPVVRSVALVSFTREDQGQGMQIWGIDPDRHTRVTGFAGTLHHHVRDVHQAFEQENDPNGPGCIIGIERIFHPNEHGRYEVTYDPRGRAYEVTCLPLTARGAPLKAGAGEFNTKTFYLSDIVHTGLAREDNYVLYIPLDAAQQLCGMAGPVKRISAIHIRFRSGVALEHGVRSMASLWQGFKQDMARQPQARLLDHCSVQSWKRVRRDYIAPMEKEQLAMILLFFMVAVTVAFIVFVVFYMLINHKRKDIGVLKSVGTSDAEVLGLFAGFSMLVGLCGAGIGVLAGALFLHYINDLEGWLYERCGFQLWDRTIFISIGEIPHQMRFEVIVPIACMAVLVSLIGAWIPTWQAARLHPIDTLRVGQE